MALIEVYKLFRKQPDGLHSLFIDTSIVLPTCTWLYAHGNSKEQLEDTEDGYNRVNIDHGAWWHQSRKPNAYLIRSATSNGDRWIEVSTDRRGHRRYYDLGLSSQGRVIRFAHRPGWHSCREPSLPGVDMTDKVWCLCLIHDDDCTIIHRNINGMTAKSQPVEWCISQKIFIVRQIEHDTKP